MNYLLMETLFTPAHIHLAINHVPIIGLAVACLPVLIGILFHNRGALASGLLAVILCAGTMPFIMETGEEAQESFVDGSISQGMDVAGKAAFREHSHRANFTAPVVYAAGILSLVALLVLIKFPRQAAWIGWAVLVGSTLSIALSIWTAEAGGRIRHPEFRPEPKSTAQPQLQPQGQGQDAPSVPELVPTPSPSPSGSMTPLPPLPVPTATVVPGALLAPAGSGATPATN
ncbi:MAG: hypothetical protein K8R57_10980 [Verrucomicrobia bacterium]|nr:hypothetical protein [Verrucomicrobiota bacterium]